MRDELSFMCASCTVYLHGFCLRQHYYKYCTQNLSRLPVRRLIVSCIRYRHLHRTLSLSLSRCSVFVQIKYVSCRVSLSLSLTRTRSFSPLISLRQLQARSRQTTIPHAQNLPAHLRICLAPRRITMQSAAMNGIGNLFYIKVS